MFHRSEEERVRRSQAQALRMTEDPVKWTRGRGALLEVLKCEGTQKLWVRSSYEQVAVQLLEADAEVSSYQYEPLLETPCLRHIKPDFLAFRKNNRPLLIEVKASWVLELALDHPVRLRLQLAADMAGALGWDFEIWTEKNKGLGNGLEAGK